MIRVVRLPAATDRDIDAAFCWHAEHADLATASRFRTRVLHDVHEVARHPWIGRERRDLSPKRIRLRSKSLSEFEAVVLFYRVEFEAREIVRLPHGARDVERVLRDDELEAVHETTIAAGSMYAMPSETALRVAC